MKNKLKRDKNLRRNVRKFRIRKKINGTIDRPRLVFTKTNKYLYAQVINDLTGLTITGLSTLKFENKGKNIDNAVVLGQKVGELLKNNNIKKVVFDRNGYLYHGKLKSFADSVRQTGIDF